ncbi:MAG: asparaginase [Actinomycetota bacterium]|nr:asparaginase [Actinomycetota bacterium]
MTWTEAPLAVEVTRGDSVESQHLVDAVVVNADGSLVEAWGDPARRVLPRSALKPIQAIPMVASGAADAFALTEIELALACASHSGEPAHVNGVTRWLDRLCVPIETLACGIHPPISSLAANGLAESGQSPSAVHNNCSGKHAGFLTLCRHLGISTDRYISPTHELQRLYVTPAIEGLCGVDLASQIPAVDGCGIPTWEIPLQRLAAGWAVLGLGQTGSPEKRLLDAMRSEPFFVAGTNRVCTRMIEGTTGGTVVKTGAEGVFCAVLPDDEVGVAVKVHDGAGRAAAVAVGWLLTRLGHLTAEEQEVLTNHEGRAVGTIRVVG